MRRCLITLILCFWGAVTSGEVILHTEKSLYRNIVVFEDDGIRCLRFTIKRRSSRQSCIDTTNPDRLVLPYVPVTFAGLLLNPEPKRVLILGMGGGTIVDVFSELFPGISMDVVEIDPAVIDVARKYFNFNESKETRVINRDGRVFTRRAAIANNQYDYIVIDVFNGDYIPEHMMTAEFLEECRQLLSENGVLVANTFSSSSLYDSESATFASVFGEFLNLRRRFGNRVIVAGRSGIPSRSTLIANSASIDTDLARFGIDLKENLALDRGRDWRRKARVLTDQYSPANLLRQKN